MDNNSVYRPMFAIDRPLWDFALQVYSIPDVEQHSIELQDEYLANINIILWCCWLQIEEIELSTDILSDVLITIDAVSLQTVAKLREVRRMLVESGSFTKVQAQSIKKHILNAELMIEKVLLRKLQDLTCRFLASSEYIDTSFSSRNLDLEYYLEFMGVPDARKNSGILLNACRRSVYQELGVL